MVLALVLATLDQTPSPEESILDTRPIMTPLSFRAFPSADVLAARRRLSGNRTRKPFSPVPLIPSLVEMLLHILRASTEPTGIRQHEELLEDRNLLHLLNQNTPFYHHYEVELVQNGRSRRRSLHSGPRTVFLTKATLIVVPTNLVSQWFTEIHKHCRSGFVRVLVLKDKKPMPTAKSLASDYDVSFIIML